MSDSNARQIVAKVHPDAIRRVSRFFDAGTAQAVDEILQNARRASATRVSISIGDDASLTFTDDGCGIENPETLLEFGRSDWTRETVRNEDPAGMGIYSLARMQPTIRSRSSRTPEGRPGWKMTLNEAHFLGTEPATVHPDDDAPLGPYGTSITIAAPAWATKRIQALQADLETEQDQRRGNAALRLRLRETYQGMLRKAALYYPVQVTVDGTQTEQVDFLEDAKRIFDWEGLRIGIMLGHGRGQGLAPMINVHGHLIWLPVAAITTLDQQSWWCKIDVKDCPQLELTLPTRERIVQSPFYENLLVRARRCILETMADQDGIQVNSDINQEATAFGLSIPEAKPELRWWEPKPASETRGVEPELEAATDTNAWMMMADLTSQDRQVLRRALNQSKPGQVVYAPRPEVRDYTWYRNFDRVTDVYIRIHYDHGRRRTMEELREANEEAPRLVDRIDVLLTVTRDDESTYQEVLPVDLALPSKAGGSVTADQAQVVSVSKTADISDLSDVLMDAYFIHDEDGDTYDRQQEECYDNVAVHLTDLFAGTEAALERIIRDKVRDGIEHEVPRNTTVTITIAREEDDTRVSLTITPLRKEATVAGPTTTTEA